MFRKTHPDYLQVEKGVRLFFETNFPHKKPPQEKPLLVFNYGLVCNFEHWGKQLPFFDQLGYPILIHNYRAHFNSSGSIESCSFENFAYDIKKIIDHLGYKKVIMLGHSMGVNVTLEFAVQFPEMLLGMVLLSGSLEAPHDVMFDSDIMGKVFPYLEAFSKDYPDFYNKVWKNSYINPLIKKIVHRGGFNTEKVGEDWVEYYLKRIGELPPELFLHLFNLMAEHKKREKDLKKVKTPTLIAGGDKDKVIPLVHQLKLMELLSKSEFYLIKDGSHVPQVDFPESVNERLEFFFKKIS